MKNLKQSMSQAMKREYDDKNPYGFIVGEAAVIDTPKFQYIGRVLKITPKCVVLSECVYVAKTAEMRKYIGNGEITEGEPFPGILTIPYDAIITWIPWTHPIPTT